MKKFFIIFLFFLITSCNSNKVTYWCGDHPCINKKEREAYFKKTMIVEVKEVDKKNYKKKSEMEKIIQQATINEKKRIKNEKELAKQEKIIKKRKIKQEKELIKQAKLDQKLRIKEEKELAKQIEVEEKKRKKQVKKMKKKKKNKVIEKNVEVSTGIINAKLDSNKFNELVEKITKKNKLRPFPNINDIPN